MPDVFTLQRQGSEDQTETITWVDLDGHADNAATWLRNQSGLPEQVVARLLQQSTLNQHESFDGGLVLRFHTRKIVPSTSETDSTSVRLWIENDRVISICSDTVPALETLKAKASQQQGRWSRFEILTCLINSQISDLENVIVVVSGETDELEEQIFESDEQTNTEDLDNVRRKTIRTRRQLVALRNLLVFILSDQSLAISGDERRAIESVTDRARSYLEILEDCHERAHLLRDQIQAQMDARLNRITYNLTIVATVFLPMSFLTGLLGMNVAGIPDEHNPLGFVIVCTAMVLIAVGSWIFLRWRKWI